MNASPLLDIIARLFQKHRIEAVMIGNAAAALQGAPVTTLDIDFMFRKTPQNLTKLKALAREIDGVIMRPYYPISQLYRVTNDSRGIQLDFMSIVHGITSFASLRSRADEIEFSNNTLLVASLDDIIKSKQAAARPQDKAVLPILRKTREEILKAKKSS